MKLRKQIKGYEGLYDVSSSGEIISLSRDKLLPNGKVCLSKEKRIRPAKIGKDGYEIVYLRKDGKSNRHYVHRIVAETFIENPNSMEFVNHKDGRKYHNSVENLEWCDRSQNARHAYRILGVGKTRKIAQYDKRGNYIKTWSNAYEAHEKLGISAGNINSCVNKYRRSAGGYRWEAVCA